MQGSLQRIERSKGLIKVEEGSRKGAARTGGWAEGREGTRTSWKPPLTLPALETCIHAGPQPCRLEVQRTAAFLIGLTCYHLLVTMSTFFWGGSRLMLEPVVGCKPHFCAQGRPPPAWGR